MMAGAVLRAHRVLHDAGLPADRLERAPSATNEVWFAGDYVVRISNLASADRLAHEIAVAQTLPENVRYPEVLASGRADCLEWVVQRRIPAEPLSRRWPSMADAERRDAISSLGVALKALHDSPGPRLADGTPWTPPFLSAAGLACPHPFPPSVAAAMFDRAARMRHVDFGLMQAAAAKIRSASEAFVGDPVPDPGLVHGDLHLENVLWDGRQVWLLDLEFARASPSDLDLDVLLRFCADPTLHVADDYAAAIDRRDLRKVPVWLHIAYPALFAHPRLAERLAVYSLAYDVRALLLEPPTKPVDELPHLHPYHRIRRTVEGRSHLEWIEW